MGVNIVSRMLVLASIVSTLVIYSQAVTPLSPDELRQIRDFTAQAHMKRLQNYPDQIMTPSTHYLGRRLPNVEKQPNIFMQAPNNNGAGVKPTPFQIEPQQAGAIQNFLVNYPITTNTIAQHQQQQQQQQQIYQQQRPQQYPLQFAPIQNGGPPRGPPPNHYKRPSFFSFGGPESSPPSSLLQFFFPKRPARRPPSFRPPIRFEYAQTQHNPVLLQHQQNLHSVMAQQHLLTVQQQQQQAQAGQQNNVQPSSAPLSAQSTTVKTSLGAQANPTATAPAAAAPVSNPQVLIGNHAGPLLHQNQHQQHFIPAHHYPHQPPFLNLNQFHREVNFFGKPVGKPGPPQKFPPAAPAFVPQNRPGDEVNYIQKYAQPQPDFSFLPLGPNLPPVIAGPTSNRFGSPVSFSHIEQMPFTLHQPQQLPMHMVVQSQEFPHYHFTTTFTASNNDGQAPASPANTPNSFVNINNQHNNVGNGHNNGQKHQEIQLHGQQAASVQSTSVRQTQRVKKLRPRPATTLPTTTLSPLPTTTQSLGDIIFESAKETREFHDSAHLSPPTISNLESVVNTKPRKPKQQKQQQQQEHVGSLQKASVESSVVIAPSTYNGESSKTSFSTSSPRPITSTLVSVSTLSTTTEEPYKPKIVKSKNTGEFHKSKPHHNHHHPHHNHEKRVTASGSGLGAVTVEPFRITSTGTSPTTTSSSGKSTLTPGGGGRVVTTSVTSRVVSIGPQNPQKRYRLRKVKVPNPEAIKANSNKTSTTSSFSSSSSSSTTNIPSTTPISTRTPRSTTTISSSTESSLTTTTV